MKRMTALLVIAPLLIALTAMKASAGWRAYNDLSWDTGQLTNKITRYTTDVGDGTPPDGDEGYLKDYNSGTNIGAYLIVTEGEWDGAVHATQGAAPASGTDGYNVFNGIVSCLGLISYLGEDKTVLTFSNLTDTVTYNIVVFANRGNYTNRVTEFTLSGADSFVNLSSSGSNFSGEDDPSTCIAGLNTANGYITRFASVDPGSDGVVVVTCDPAPGYSTYFYASALMIETEDEAGTIIEVSQTEKSGAGVIWQDILPGFSAALPENRIWPGL